MQEVAKLPNLVFFDPCPDFVDWLFTYAAGNKRLIVDAGAGVGRLGRELGALGMQIVSIDVVERESPESMVFPWDATEYKYKPFHLVVLARPCRGPWIEESIRRACEAGAEVLYVGREKWLEFDTVFSGISREKVFEDAGDEEETAYMLRAAGA